MIGFVHIPKTAGTTVKFILRNSIGLKHCDVKTKNPDGILSDKDLNFAKKIFFWGLNSIAGHSLISPATNISRSVQYFTFIREPAQRCASHYQHTKRAMKRKGNDISFKEFIKNENMQNVQVKQIAGGLDIEKAIAELKTKYLFVGLTERFGESMQILQTLCPYKMDLRHKKLHVAKDNAAKKDALENPANLKLLKKNNAMDQKLYEFVKDVIYPAQLKKAGMLNTVTNVKEEKSNFYPYKYKLARAYNQAIYRSLMKMGKRYTR